MAPKLIVEVIGDTSRLEKSFKRAGLEATGFGSSLGRLSVGFGQLAKGVIEVDILQKAFQGLHSAVDLGIEGFSDTQRVAAQTVAVLKSTGGAANISADKVHALAASLSNLSGIDDEVIQSGENILLSFTQIRDFAGKNNDIFTQATKVITDYASRTGKAMSTSATIIGRALADPATKAVALSRAGIVLTKSQLDGLKAIEKTSGVVAAQKVLLGDLEKRYQGAAEAAGKTLPGQLDVLRERFKDLAGEIVGNVAPSIEKIVGPTTDFVRKLTETKGAHAKFELTLDTGEDLGRKLFDAITKQVEAINWGELASKTGKLILDGFKSINFGAVGRDLGNAFSKVINFISAAARRVNWNAVGRDLVKGAEAIVVALARFLAGVPWGKVLGAIGRLATTALSGIARIWLGIGEQLGKALISGIGKGLDAVGDTLERKAIKIVLGIIDPFTSLPGILGPEGGIARNLKDKLHATLDSLNAPSAADGAAVGENIFAGIIAGVNAQGAALTAAVQGAIANSQAAGAGARNNSGAGLTTPTVLPAVPIPKPSGGLTATQKNTFFDNAISSDLTRAGFITNIKAQIGALQNIAGLISARIAATKDVTRRRTLEDQLLSVDSQITGDRQQVAQDFLTALQFGVTKAQATANFKDDIKAITALQDGIKAEIKATGATIDLQGQLLQTQQDLVTARNNARNATQFKALGLTATGDTVTPGVKRLKGELSTLTGAITGTFLDTSKTQSVLSQLSKVLAGGLGVVGQQVRQKVQDIIDGLNNQLKGNAANLTKFAHVSSAALVAGLGLSPDVEKALRSRISQVGPGGTIPGVRSQAFALAGAGSSPPPITVESHTTLMLDGKVLTKTVTTTQQKANRRRSVGRRGPFAGRN